MVVYRNILGNMKSMKKVISVGVVSLMVFAKLAAQQTNHYNLQQCIDAAIQHNIDVNLDALRLDAAKVNEKQAKANLLPDLNANLDHGINQGRSIDPYTNTYVDQTVRYAGYGVSSGITVFNGFNLQQLVKQNKYASQAAGMEWQQRKDNTTLSVILAYLAVLSNEDLLAAARQQKELSSRQVQRLQVLDSQGAIPPSQLTDLKGQSMNDELSIISLRNQLESSKIALLQLMNQPYTKDITLDRIAADEFLAAYEKKSGEVYDAALKQFALIKAVGLRTKSAQSALQAAKGSLYPTLFLSGNAQTNYSSAAQNTDGKIAYGEQVKNNLFTTINLGLRIPIFNNARNRNNVKLANINVKQARLEEQNTKTQLQRDIEQAYLNMNASYESYKTLQEQVNAYSGSYRAAEIRFQSGVGTSVDYLIAKNNLDKANISLISAKYDFVLRKKILDYYQGLGGK